jgi:hypothetical protein
MVDTVVIQSTPPATPEDHEQKMMAKVDATNATPPDEGTVGTPPPEDRPQWLPEKFKSPEDMAKAYAELEAKLGQGKPAEPQVPPEPAKATPEDADKALQDKGLNLQDFSKEFSEKGELSAESYEKLAKAGYDKNLVDQYIEGQRARAAQFESGIKSEVGGEQAYVDMVTWAKANLSPSEIDAYNAAVSTGNSDQAKLAALGLKMKFEKANGSDPQRLLSGQNSAQTSDVYESVAELKEAMKDPRYKNDPAYRAKVQQKLGRSNVL